MGYLFFTKVTELWRLINFPLRGFFEHNTVTCFQDARDDKIYLKSTQENLSSY